MHRQTLAQLATPLRGTGRVQAGDIVSTISGLGLWQARVDQSTPIPAEASIEIDGLMLATGFAVVVERLDGVRHRLDCVINDDHTVSVTTIITDTVETEDADGNAPSLRYDQPLDITAALRTAAAALLAEARAQPSGVRRSMLAGASPGNPDFLEEVHRMYSEGRTLGEIGELYGRSVSAVSRWYTRAVTELGLPDERKTR